MGGGRCEVRIMYRINDSGHLRKREKEKRLKCEQFKSELEDWKKKFQKKKKKSQNNQENFFLGMIGKKI